LKPLGREFHTWVLNESWNTYQEKSALSSTNGYKPAEPNKQKLQEAISGSV
jgi:hypothetical protein